MTNILKHVGLFALGCVLSIPLSIMMALGADFNTDEFSESFIAGVISFYALFAIIPGIALFRS